MKPIMSKYLTILAGNPRGGEKTWESLYKYVIDHLNSDLAVCTGDKWVSDVSLFEKADYKWIFNEPEDWYEYYKNNFKGNWKEFFTMGKDTGLYNSGNIHFAIKDIILKNYLEVLKKYEFIIYTRFDQFYTDYHISIEEEDGDNIWIPEGENYHGMGDRHAVIPTQYIEEFLSICNYVDSEESIINPPDYLNCETAYLRFLTSNGLIKNVKRYERLQFTSATNKDITNWRIPKYRVSMRKNLLIKYPDEFIDSVNNSLKNKKFSYFFQEPTLCITYFYLSLRRKFGKTKKS
tara:strand:+ start:390 stop:1262 length:873 start_codon:yes stop_codon:yes gene_type:complete